MAHPIFALTTARQVARRESTRRYAASGWVSSISSKHANAPRTI